MKITTSNIHLEIFGEAHRELLYKLIPHIKDFVLSGGTALSLQLAHRKSFDFDFFSQKEIPKRLLEQVSKIISVGTVSVDSTDELTIFTKDQIKVTFLYYPFKPHYKRIEVENGVNLFSIKEIAVQKAYTIGRRGEYRDYFDLYTILKKNRTTLAEIILAAQKVYGSLFNDKLFLQQLVYFRDLTDYIIIPVVPGTLLPSHQVVKEFFEEIVKNIFDK